MRFGAHQIEALSKRRLVDLELAKRHRSVVLSDTFIESLGRGRRHRSR